MFIIQSDSIFADTLQLVKSPEVYPSLITENLHSGELTAIERTTVEHPFWIAGILIASFVLLAWGRIFFGRRLEMIFRAVFGKNYANQLIREGNIFNERIGLVLFMIYLAMVSLFVYLAVPMFAKSLPDIKPILLYLLLMGFFLGFWFMKVMVSRFLSALFNTGEHSRELLSNMYLYNLFAGILLLPLVTCMAFARLEIFFYVTLAILFILYTFRIIREALIGFNVIKFSVFHLFLYLCTLEILPMIVLAKILTRNMIL